MKSRKKSWYLHAIPALALLAAGNANAATTVITWQGTTATTGTNWNTAGNWFGGSKPVTGNAIAFGANSASSATLNDDLTTAAFNIAGITFNSNAVAYTLAGNAFTLGGDITNNSTNLETINNAITLNGNRTITTATSGGVTIGGAISGNYGITKSGSGAGVTGVLTLTGNNTYTGATTINSGTLSIGGAGTLNNGNYAGAIGISSTNGGTFNYASTSA